MTGRRGMALGGLTAPVPRVLMFGEPLDGIDLDQVRQGIAGNGTLHADMQVLRKKGLVRSTPDGWALVLLPQLLAGAPPEKPAKKEQARGPELETYWDGEKGKAGKSLTSDKLGSSLGGASFNIGKGQTRRSGS